MPNVIESSFCDGTSLTNTIIALIFYTLIQVSMIHKIVKSGNTKGGSITVLLTSYLTGLE